MKYSALFFVLNLPMYIFYTYSTFQLGLATFQVPNRYKRLVTIILDNEYTIEARKLKLYKTYEMYTRSYN